jgi:hypothetical protein
LIREGTKKADSDDMMIRLANRGERRGLHVFLTNSTRGLKIDQSEFLSIDQQDLNVLARFDLSLLALRV